MRKKIVAATLLLTACAGMVRPQTVDLKEQRVPMTDLEGRWRFHIGDDQAWASPAFDDSQWSLLAGDNPWGVRGYRGYSGVGRYRLRVLVPAHSGPLAIYFPEVQDCYQVFANGRLIGQVGELPPRPKLVNSNRNMFRIPTDAVGPEQPLMLLTDGVVEARNHSGDLFGFERTATISTESANQIADAAEHFGQEDDITVLTLSFTSVGAIHA